MHEVLPNEDSDAWTVPQGDAKKQNDERRGAGQRLTDMLTTCRMEIISAPVCERNVPAVPEFGQ